MYRKKYVSGICAALVAALMAGCGSSSSTTNTKSNVTGLTKRVLLSNITPTGGDVLIVDGNHDTFATKAIGTSQPSKMVTAAGITVIRNSTLSEITIFNNAQEQVTATTPMQGQPFDVAISPDGLTGYAAIKNVGVVEVVNSSSGNLVGNITIPSVARLVEGPKGHKQLAFSDDPQALGSPNANAFFVIDTATNTATPVVMPVGSQPFTAVFDPSDTNDTTAFILNCGAECGGDSGSPSFTPTVPSVVKVNFATVGSPVFTSITGSPIAGATVGLISSSNLFVAGTPVSAPAGCPLTACGTLQVINSGTLTAGAAIPITNGLHQQMAMSTNNHLYVGASHCTVGPVSAQSTVQGCLSIFNTGAGASSTNPVFPMESSIRQNFDVTGFQQISGRPVMYVMQGGELDFFDINTDAPSTSIQPLDVVGLGVDVIQIDP